ncbi:ubiquitin-conjugating enzyme E2 J2-like [Dermatophagoides farinae]|uniref:ubiquitin-conjugating enzyme E2 J2-like n=1 Tax=Dermatophagoides farinae TaxID=6954 RepID=UPI001F0F2581|nr:ubiquitin-conjugating enzyme E2 J2-like [Dermatophagoides farinae]
MNTGGGGGGRRMATNINGVRQNAQNNSKKFISSWRRLKQDYMMIMKDPVPYVTVAPLQNDILEWHYVIRGPENTVYNGGIYHGKLKFPIEYPFRPPSIYMITPSGRFKTNTRLCLSFSDFHPDSWNPTWSLSTILTGLLSFMLEEHNAVGSLQASDSVRRIYAKKSLQFNLNDATFVELFPDIADEIECELERIKTLEAANQKNSNKNNNDKSSKDSTNNNGSNERQSEYDRFNRFVWSCVYNLIALFIVILFAYIVQWVLSEYNQ